MKPKIKKMNWFIRAITFGNIVGITLAPFGIYLKEEYLNNITTINHESIHWKQQLEMLIIFFYLWYLIEWGLKTIIPLLNQKLPKDAYYQISFEREAYGNEKNLSYLETRKPFSWWKHLKV